MSRDAIRSVARALGATPATAASIATVWLVVLVLDLADPANVWRAAVVGVAVAGIQGALWLASGPAPASAPDRDRLAGASYLAVPPAALKAAGFSASEELELHSFEGNLIFRRKAAQ